MQALFGPLFADAGLPPGCLQILNYSEADVGHRMEQLIADPDVRASIVSNEKIGKAS